MITIDVLLRKFFGVTMGGADEITGYVFAIVTVWAFAYCVLYRANVRIDAVYNFMPRRIQVVIDIISIAMLLIFVALLTNKAFFTVSESWANKTISITPLKTPMWIPQVFWVAGLVFFVGVLAFLLIQTCAAMVRGDLDAVRRIAGMLSRQEEIEEATRGTEAEVTRRKKLS